MTAVERLDEIGAHLNAAYKELGEVCTRGPSKRFRMSIPANPERDTDLIIDRALMDATQAGAALRAVLALHAPVSRGQVEDCCSTCCTDDECVSINDCGIHAEIEDAIDATLDATS